MELSGTFDLTFLKFCMGASKFFFDANCVCSYPKCNLFVREVVFVNTQGVICLYARLYLPIREV